MDVFKLRAVLGLDSTEYDKGLDQKKQEAGGIGSAIGGALGTAAQVGVAAVTAATGAAVAFGATAVKAGSEFDSSMSQVAATMGKTMDEMQNEVGTVDLAWGTFSGNLREYAQEMGANTAFSAKEAADALNYMALAGYDTQTSMEMLPNVLNLAAAGDLQLATASDMVTDAQSALGLSLEETSTMVDQMAAASSKSNTSVGQLGDAFLTIGATARNLKGGTVELSQVLGVLADNGIKGAEGGTHLRNAILSLQTPTKAGSEALAQLGMSYKDMYDSAGNMRALPEIFQEMQARMEGMTQASKDAIISGVFNKTDLAAVNALIGTTGDRWLELDTEIRGAWFSSDALSQVLNNHGISMDNMRAKLGALGISAEDFDYALKQSGGDADMFADFLLEMVNEGTSFSDVVDALGGDLDTLGLAFSETTGAAQKMADTQLDNLQGDITLFKSALEGVQIAVSDQLTPSLREFVEFGSDGLTKLTEAFKEDGLSGAMDAFGDIIAKGITMIVEKLPDVVNAGMQILSALVQGLIQNIPQLTQAAVDIILLLANGLAQNAPMIINGAVTLVTTLGQAIITNAPQLLQAAVNLVQGLVDGIGQNLGLVNEEGGLTVGQLVTGILSKLPDVINSANDLLKGFLAKISENLPNILQSGIEMIVNLVTGILEQLPAIIESAGQIFNTFLNFIISSLPQILSAGIQLIISLTSGILQMIPKVIASANDVFLNLLQTIISRLPEILAAGVKLITELIAGIAQMHANVIQAGIDTFNAVKDSIMDRVKQAAEWGRHLITNFIDGIKDAWNGLKDKVSDIAEGVAGFFEHSKPKSWSPFYGEETWFPHMFENLADSVQASKHILTDALDMAFADVQPDLNGEIDIDGTGNRRSGVTVVQNIYSEAKTAAELMREARWEQERAVLTGV